MKVFIIRDSDFTLNGTLPASNLLHYDAYAKRYLTVFKEVVIVGRLFEVQDPTAKPITGEGVIFLPLPGYRGPMGFAKSLLALLAIAWRSTQRGNAYILRVPASIPSIFAFVLFLKRIPFSVEVAADPYDGYSAAALNNNRLSFLYQRLFVWLVKWQCRKARSTAYVTANALQKRYPPGVPSRSYSFTSIDLTEEAYVQKHRPVVAFEKPSWRFVMIGNMQKSLKGHDILLEAFAVFLKSGVDATLTIIGFGEAQVKFEKLAYDLAIGDRVTFTGKIAGGAPIRSILDTGDIFLLPSRQEGLPRALLEAMARALPAIATRVGGTPELLPDHALVNVDDAQGLAAKMLLFVKDPNLLASESSRNLSISKRYNARDVSSRRDDFYKSCLI